MQNDGHLLAISEQETAMAEKGDVGAAGVSSSSSSSSSSPRTARTKETPRQSFPEKTSFPFTSTEFTESAIFFSFPDPHSSRVYL